MGITVWYVVPWLAMAGAQRRPDQAPGSTRVP
jgi:hypothetical protein